MKEYIRSSVDATCPVCYHPSGHLLYSVTSEQAAQHFVTKQVNLERFLSLQHHIKQLWQQDTCDIVCCDNCSFGFAHPYAAGDYKFYDLAYERSGYPNWKWEYQITYEKLASQARHDFKLLEIGAGDGRFTKRITPELTAKENVFCIEYSDYGKDCICQYGVQCISEDVRSWQQEFQQYFDVVCMFQVLEHLDDLDTLFKRISEITQSKASWFIAVPNPQMIAFNELNGALLDMPPNHIGRWNRDCFAVIAQRHGWQIVEHCFEPGKVKLNVQQFLDYRYLQRVQMPDSLANLGVRIKNRYLRRMVREIARGLELIRALPAINALRSCNFGDSQWVYLQKL